MRHLLAEIRNCTHCIDHLENGCNPILSANRNSKIAVIGQAPGIVVHTNGIPWNDKSGERLREWMNISNEDFYDPNKVALIPMGFCYPGKGKTGDLPPRKECAPLWHDKLFDHMNELELVLLVGSYAQGYYLKGNQKTTLTETVKDFETYLPNKFPLPHPSPRNNIWLKKNQWFEKDLVPILKSTVSNILE